MKPPQASMSAVNENLRLLIYVRLHNLFSTYLYNLNCFYIPAGDYRQWRPLFYSQLARLPVHFETFFGRIPKRTEYNNLHFSRLEKDHRPLVGKHMGFHEIFVPVLHHGRCQGILVAGPFSKAPPTIQELNRQWEILSDRKPAPNDLDFLLYIRMALSIQVLPPAAVAGCREMLEILASYMSGQVTPAMAESLEVLRKGPISHHLPHARWMDFILGLDKFLPSVRMDGGIHEWETEELGITRYPTTVLAVTPHSTAPEIGSPLESMVHSNKLQWEAQRIAREFPETVAGKLEDYGALFVTSASPSKSKVQARLEIHDRMESIRRRLEKRTGMRLWAGVGATLPPGDQLLESRRQAVSALGLCASLEKSVVFFEDHPGPISQKWSRGLRMALRQLLKAYLRGSDQEKESARGEYVRQALLYSNERGESLRAHLLEAVFILTESLRGRMVLGDESDILIDALEGRLQNALTIRDMLMAFREGLEGFARIGTKPSEGKRLAGMEQMKQYVDEHFAEPLRITELAARMGLSKPAFLNNFRLRTGQGFSQYLQNRRLEEAKLMLRSGSLSIARVAQECGFNSSSYFIQAFRRLAHMSPGQYRGKRQR